MEVIRLEKSKEWCDKHNVERNEWVAGAIDKVLTDTHAITYRREKDNVRIVITRETIQSEMQSAKTFDAVLSKAIDTLDVVPLLNLERKQAMLTIGELADDFEIGIA